MYRTPCITLNSKEVNLNNAYWTSKLELILNYTVYNM